MTGADFIYYWSPWSLPLIAGLIFFGGLSLFAPYRRALRAKKINFVLTLCGGLAFVVVILGLMASRVMQTSGPRLVIHQDYLACGAWTHDGRFLRVPWHAFADISSQRGWGRRFLFEVDLHFDLDPRYLAEVPWTESVRSKAAVNCEISELTDNPRRFGFATDTSEIQAQVEAAWRAGRNR